MSRSASEASAGTAQDPDVSRRRLIFFASTDPQASTKPLWTAYHFGMVAHGAGLDAEVRLAGDAVAALLPDGLPAGPDGERVAAKMSEALASGLFVSG
jgi:hypothetical protein